MDGLMPPPECVSLLVCPETRRPLTLMPRMKAEQMFGGPLVSLRKMANAGNRQEPWDASRFVLVDEDQRRAYPVAQGVPVLLAPEMLGLEHEPRQFDLHRPKYAEAYEEMEHYNRVATEEAKDIQNSESYRLIEPFLRANRQERGSFPYPRRLWIDAVYDCASQWDAYEHVAPLTGSRVLQLGGKGVHAVKFLLAGAAEAWTVTPMLGEALCARALAEVAGVADRLRCVVAIAEELPFPSGSISVVYSGGCLHHMVTELALPEIARVLEPAGKFAAVDPWKAPLYALGTRLLGKRETEVSCRPLTASRIAPLYQSFQQARVVQHGSLTRYPLLALSKFGVPCSLRTVWSINKVDDLICSILPGFRGMGSSVALLGVKGVQ